MPAPDQRNSRSTAASATWDQPPPLTVYQVAERFGISSRWLADQCRTSKIEHLRLAGKRLLTEDQVHALMTKHIIRATADVKLDAERARVMRELANRQRRPR